MFWDQGKEKIYSNQFIRIEQPDKILTGYGFESNQQMTEYQIFNNTGIFTVEDTAPADTTKNRKLCTNQYGTNYRTTYINGIFRILLWNGNCLCVFQQIAF